MMIPGHVLAGRLVPVAIAKRGKTCRWWSGRTL